MEICDIYISQKTVRTMSPTVVNYLLELNVEQTQSGYEVFLNTIHLLKCKAILF